MSGPSLSSCGPGAYPAWHGLLTGAGVEWHTARPLAMASPLEPVDRTDAAPGVSLAVGRLLPRGP